MPDAHKINVIYLSKYNCIRKKHINKLSLNKSTIANLSDSDLGNINGGVASKGCQPQSFYCPTNSSCTFVNTCGPRTLK
ncbi:MAG: class I lanthipeptide [Bacteroidetes bacterium]|nr:class I lanthipeptide [Bacteroidota bacterium]